MNKIRKYEVSIRISFLNEDKMRDQSQEVKIVEAYTAEDAFFQVNQFFRNSSWIEKTIYKICPVK